MNKFQFIKHLLDTKKFTPAQKERFFKLVSAELSNVEIQDEKILEDIELIKNKIGLKKEKSSGKGILTRLMGEARLKNELGDNEDAERKKFGSAKEFTAQMHKYDYQQKGDRGIKKTGLEILMDKETSNKAIKAAESKELKTVKEVINSDAKEEMSEGLKALLAAANPPYVYPEESKENSGAGLKILLEAGLAQSVVAKNKRKDSEKRSKNNEVSGIGSEIRYTTYKNLPSFLRRLNANDYTKFLTHSVDSTDILKLKNLFVCDHYNFELHLKKIKEVFDVLTVKHSVYKKDFPELRSYFLPKGIYTKIKQYIYGKTWSLENSIKMYWSHPSIIDWTVDNSGKAPSANEESLNYEGFYFFSTAFNKQMSFSDLILFFKNEIHIRSTNSLHNLINNIYNNPDNSFKELMDVENNILQNLDFYTDVEKLRAAIKLILELILEKHSIDNKPRVLFNVSVEDDEITLSILHIGNPFEQNIETLRYGKSICNLIDLLNGVCGLEILARFSDSKSYRLKLWEYGDILRENTIYRHNKPLVLKEKLISINEDINGVQYNLTFNRGL